VSDHQRTHAALDRRADERTGRHDLHYLQDFLDSGGCRPDIKRRDLLEEPIKVVEDLGRRFDPRHVRLNAPTPVRAGGTAFLRVLGQ
jgi:hypothetical protein